MIPRRNFLHRAAATGALAVAQPVFGKSVGHKERVDRALRGQDLDRPPFTFYHHYKRPTPQLEAEDHLKFHRAYETDIVKVMNDFDYPRAAKGNWYELDPVESPYPNQLKTLQIIRDRLQGDAYFIDTLYGPYMTAMLLFQAQPQFAGRGNSEEVTNEVISSLHEFQKSNTDGWHRAMEAITQSTLNHIRQARKIGTSGALVSVFNAESKFGSVSDYEQYSRPYDKRVLDALADTKLTILHLHYLERPYLEQFRDFHPPVIQYSVRTSEIPISEVRKTYSQPILGGVDEIDFDKLTVDQMRRQWTQAREQAGPKYIAAPGCSVPDASTSAELVRFPRSLGISV
jgi:uroporphyrinogen decarboxylase